jgi:hypothetical protein
LIAFVDESIEDWGVGTYVIGCVVVPHFECEELRREVQRRGPFHFNSASLASQLSMLRWIGVAALLPAGYIYRGLYPIGREGARQVCLVRLLRDLRDWDVEELVIERRRSWEDTRDAVTIIHGMHAGSAPPGLCYAWRPKSEAMLRLPDAVAGAIRADRRLGAYQSTLKRIGTVRRIAV